MKDTQKTLSVGTILVYSIGCGCDQFWQVISKTPKSVKARKLEYKIVNHSLKHQTFDKLPIKDKFCPPEIGFKYLGGYKDGNPRYKEGVDKNTITLKIAEDGRIGPIKRLMWWSIWDGKQKNQWSP